MPTIISLDESFDDFERSIGIVDAIDPIVRDIRVPDPVVNALISEPTAPALDTQRHNQPKIHPREGRLRKRSSSPTHRDHRVGLRVPVRRTAS